MADPNVLKQYIFQKGFVTEAGKQKRLQEAANSTLQVRSPSARDPESPRALSGLEACCAVQGPHKGPRGMVRPNRAVVAGHRTAPVLHTWMRPRMLSRHVAAGDRRRGLAKGGYQVQEE